MRDAARWIEGMAGEGLLPAGAVAEWGGRADATPAELAAFLKGRLADSPRRAEILAAFAAAGTRRAGTRRRLPLAALAVVASAMWAAWSVRERVEGSAREARARAEELARQAARREAEGDLAGALDLHRRCLKLDPGHRAARAGRARARDTLLFAQALADAREALDSGARAMAEGHARVAESIWPGNAAVRALVEQAQGLGRLRVSSDAPCTLLLRAGAGTERSLSCPRSIDALLAPGEYEVWAVGEPSSLRRLTVLVPAHGEVRLSLGRVLVRPDERGRGLQEAVDAAAPGTTLVLASGAWSESVVVRTDHLRLEAESPGGTVLRAPDPARECLRAEGVRGLELAGLVLEGGAAGLRAEGGSGLRVRGCTVRGNEVGLLLVDAADARVDGCEVVENREYGIYGQVRSGWVVNCRFMQNGGGGVVLERSADVVVAANVLLRHRLAAIHLARGGGGAEVANNLVQGAGQGIVSEAAPCRVRHNTCLETRTVGIEALHRGDLGGLTVVDNLVALGAGVGLHLREGEAMGALAVSDRNALWSNAVAAQWTEGRRAESFATLAEWRARTDLDRTSQEADPRLEDGGSGRLGEGSPCRNAASDEKDIGVEFDGARPRPFAAEALSLPEWGRRLLR